MEQVPDPRPGAGELLIEVHAVGVCGTDLPAALELLAGRRRPWDDVAPVALALDDVVDQGLRPLVRGERSRVTTLVDPWTTRSRPTDMVSTP